VLKKHSKASKLLTVFIALTFLVSMTGSAFAATVHVGSVGFETDMLDNDLAYLGGFQSYLAGHANDPIIVNAGSGFVFDANAFSNAPEGTSIGDFVADNPVENPPSGNIWDGTGTPGETQPIEADLTAYNAALAAVTEADYTAESWAAYQAIVAANVVTVANTQEEVDAATAAITAAQANLVVKPVALAVESVSAINGTTIEVTFNRAPADDETLTYTVAGTAYVPTLDGAVATLTVPTMVDDTAYAVVVNDGEADLYNAELTYDKNEPTTLTVTNVDPSQTVGENYNLVVRLDDEDGDVIVNKDLTANITPTPFNNNEPLVLTATTDANGLATFTWTRLNPDAAEAVDIYVNERPVVRTAFAVEWLTTLKLVSVNQTAAQTLGLGTPVEYVVTAKTSAGAAYTGDLGVMFTGTAATDANIDGQYKNAAGTWTAIPNLAGADAYYDSIALTTAVTGTDGSATFRFYSENAGTTNFQPTFFQDINSDDVMTANEARVVGGTVNYVAQIPTFTWTAENDKTILATAGTTDVNKVYTLKAVDQFGNPYRGAVTIDDKANADGLAGTSAGSEQLDVDLNANGTFAGAELNVGLPYSLDFALSSRTLAGEGDSAKVQINDGTAETVQLVAFVDIANPVGTAADVAGIYDSNDRAAFTDELDFQLRAITTIVPYDIDEGNPAVGGSKSVGFQMKDQFGDAITGVTGVGIVVEAVTSGSAIAYADQDLTYTTALKDAGTAPTLSGSATQTNLTVTGDILVVNVDSGATGDTSNIRVWIDKATTATWQPDEYSVVSPVTFAAQELGSGAIAAVTTDGTLVNNGNLTSGYSDYTGTVTTTLQYDLLDQSNAALNTTEDVNVKWTITNNGSANITVNDGSAKTLAAGATTTYTTVAAAGATANATIDIASAAEGKVAISVVADGLDTPDTYNLYYTENIVAATDGIFNGTVVAFDHTVPAAADDSGWIILNTAVGFVVAPHDLGTQTYVVAGNTASEAQFKNSLSVGDVVNVDASGANCAFNITTNN